jgi:hypothetical protein
MSSLSIDIQTLYCVCQSYKHLCIWFCVYRTKVDVPIGKFLECAQLFAWLSWRLAREGQWWVLATLPRGSFLKLSSTMHLKIRWLPICSLRETKSLDPAREHPVPACPTQHPDANLSYPASECCFGEFSTRPEKRSYM